jgi:hemerythrin-like domain-containing protein
MSKIKIYEAGEQLNRIANALEEVLRLVKKDQEDAKKRMLAAADEGLKEHQETDELSKEWRV